MVMANVSDMTIVCAAKSHMMSVLEQLISLSNEKMFVIQVGRKAKEYRGLASLQDDVRNSKITTIPELDEQLQQLWTHFGSHTNRKKKARCHRLKHLGNALLHTWKIHPANAEFSIGDSVVVDDETDSATVISVSELNGKVVYSVYYDDFNGVDAMSHGIEADRLHLKGKLVIFRFIFVTLTLVQFSGA
jgi:hypothetical protein